MVSSITYYDDCNASSSWARSDDTIACVHRNQAAPNHPPPANSLGWCAAHLRLSSGSSDGAPHIFGPRSFRMIGKLLLPAAERKAAATLAEAVAPEVAPVASHVEPRAIRKAVRLNRKTKTEGSNKHKHISCQSHTVAGSTEGRSRSCSSSAPGEESVVETTSTAAGIWIRCCFVRRSTPRQGWLGTCC